MWRDGGDAETDLGADMGVGLAFADSASGLTFNFRARGLVALVGASGFQERGTSAASVWDTRPRSDPGPSISLGRSLGASFSGGMDALLSSETLAGLAEGEFGYGLP